MFSKFRTDVLIELGSFDSDTLATIAAALDKVSHNYAITAATTDIAVVGREQFREIALAYTVTKKTEGLSKGTIYNTAKTLDAFIIAMNKPISEVKANDVRAYLFTYQQKRGVSNRTLESMRSKLCTFFKWVTTEGYIDKDPTANLKTIKYIAQPRKALTQIELEKVRRACRNERETCIVEALYSTGCRVSELLGIKLTDINFDKREILVLGKGGKFRTVFLNAKALLAIQTYLATRKHKSEYLLCNDMHGGGQMRKAVVEAMFNRIEDETGIRVTPHIMRHTFATQALQGTGVEVVQKMLGHSSIATTMIYAEVNEKSIHAAHERCVI